MKKVKFRLGQTYYLKLHRQGKGGTVGNTGTTTIAIVHYLQRDRVVFCCIDALSDTSPILSVKKSTGWDNENSVHVSVLRPISKEVAISEVWKKWHEVSIDCKKELADAFDISCQVHTKVIVVGVDLVPQ